MQKIYRGTPMPKCEYAANFQENTHSRKLFFCQWFNITFNFARGKRQVAGYKNEVPRLLYSKFQECQCCFDGYPENLTTADNTHKCRLACYFKEKRMQFQGTLNKQRVINVIMTEFKKPGCNALYSSDDADIDMTLIQSQVSKFLEISYN